MKRLQEFQARADRRWGFDFQEWDSLTGNQRGLPYVSELLNPELEGNIRRLEFIALALCGEVGELANCVKKIRRKLLLGNSISDDHYQQLQSEVADILAYLLKLCNLQKWDLAEIYKRKMAENEQRFSRNK